MAVSLRAENCRAFGNVGNDSGVSFKGPGGVVMPNGVEGKHVLGDQQVGFLFNRENMGKTPFPQYRIGACTYDARRSEVSRLSGTVFTCDQ